MQQWPSRSWHKCDAAGDDASLNADRRWAGQPQTQQAASGAASQRCRQFFNTLQHEAQPSLACILQFGYKNSNWSNEDRQNLQLATCLANLLQVTVTRLLLSHQQHRSPLPPPALPSPHHCSEVASSFSRAPVSRIMIVRESHRTAISRLVWNVNAIAAISANLCSTLIMVATNWVNPTARLTNIDRESICRGYSILNILIKVFYREI